MRFRKLRIAWSVGCGIACVLVIVLWVRSYSHPGSLSYSSAATHLAIGWESGTLGVERHAFRSGRQHERGWAINIDHVSRMSVRIPLWVCAVVCGVFAAASWVVKRFSLRALLIATTLVAVVLGLVVAVLR